mgnify:CR=1 FL=1
MLPSILMGLKEEKFKNFDNLIKNTKFIDGLIDSVSSTIFYIKNKKLKLLLLLKLKPLTFGFSVLFYPKKLLD